MLVTPSIIGREGTTYSYTELCRRMTQCLASHYGPWPLGVENALLSCKGRLSLELLLGVLLHRSNLLMSILVSTALLIAAVLMVGCEVR